jgi:hypothetical protein
MRKIAIAATVVVTLAFGVVGYAATRPRPTHCARTAALKAAKAAKEQGVQIVSAVDHSHHHHIQKVIDPIPDCYPCDDQPAPPPVHSTCDCSFWTALWHCSVFM